MSDEGDARARHFRDLFDVSGEWALLNHGGYGRVAGPVREAQAAHRRWVDEAPIRFFVAERRERSRRVREALAARIGADAEDVALVPNATFGLNALAHSAAAHGLDTVGTSLDYDGVIAMWRQLGAQGHPHRVVDVDPATPAPMDALCEGLEGGADMVLLPHVASPTATFFDVGSRRVQARVVAVDGAHVPGHLALDVPSLGVDAYVGDLHKWVCAPRGTAFLWLRRELHDWLRVPVASATTIEDAADLGARLDWLGTSDPSAWLALPEALDLSESELAPAARGQAALVARTVGELEGRGWTALPTHPDLMMRSIVAPDALVGPDAAAFVDAARRSLLDARVDAPVVPLGAGRVAIRASLAWYVTDEDADRLLRVIDALAR